MFKFFNRKYPLLRSKVHQKLKFHCKRKRLTFSDFQPLAIKISLFPLAFLGSKKNNRPTLKLFSSLIKHIHINATGDPDHWKIYEKLLENYRFSTLLPRSAVDIVQITAENSFKLCLKNSLNCYIKDQDTIFAFCKLYLFVKSKTGYCAIFSSKSDNPKHVIY